MKTTTKLWMGIAVLILLSPLGLILPEYFKAKGAWGEWGSQTIKDLIGYIPKGFEKLAHIWSAPVPDYALKGAEGKGLGILSFHYIVSALIGVAVTVLIVWAIGKLLTKKDKTQ